MQIEAKLKTNAYLFNLEARKIQYVRDRTAGLVYDYIWPRLAKHEFKTAKEVFTSLTSIYNDLHKKQKAKAELAKLY